MSCFLSLSIFKFLADFQTPLIACDGFVVSPHHVMCTSQVAAKYSFISTHSTFLTDLEAFLIVVNRGVVSASKVMDLAKALVAFCFPYFIVNVFGNL